MGAAGVRPPPGQPWLRGLGTGQAPRLSSGLVLTGASAGRSRRGKCQPRGHPGAGLGGVCVA